jgi:hypothetical protein
LSANSPSDDGLVMAVLSAEGFGLVGDDARFVQERLTPHPVATVQ